MYLRTQEVKFLHLYRVGLHALTEVKAYRSVAQANFYIYLLLRHTKYNQMCVEKCQRNTICAYNEAIAV